VSNTISFQICRYGGSFQITFEQAGRNLPAAAASQPPDLFLHRRLRSGDGKKRLRRDECKRPAAGSFAGCHHDKLVNVIKDEQSAKFGLSPAVTGSADGGEAAKAAKKVTGREQDEDRLGK
jgi:hypothetical protein